MTKYDDALALVDSHHDALYRDAMSLYDEMVSEYHRLYETGALTGDQLEEMLRDADLMLDMACRHQIVSVSACLQRRHRARFGGCRRRQKEVSLAWTHGRMDVVRANGGDRRSVTVCVCPSSSIVCRNW